MITYVALLRAVNLGGASTLPMASLRGIAETLGFANVRTFIASGNLLVDSDLKEADVKARLEQGLAAHTGKDIPVFVRSAEEMAAVVAADPFPEAKGSWHMVFFYDEAPPHDLVGQCRDIAGERLALGTRELYVDYGAGIRTSKLKIPGKANFTSRNINSVRTLARMAAET